VLRLNPVLDELGSYPFTRLAEAKRAVTARGIELVDFGIGEPREETPAFIRDAFRDAVDPLSAYPAAEGMPELRAAIAAWVQRRFGVALDPATEVVPTLGSKEAVFHLAQVVAGDRVVVTAPGYPVPERGARFAGKQVQRIAMPPDLDAIDWDGVAILWLNYPNNPTGATAPDGLYERAAALAREHGFVVASDEAYSELFFGSAPRSALEVADRTNVVVFNTLSKRSSMPGYRSGFAAGDPAIVTALKRYRPNVGVAPQHVVQRASVAAWGDEAHVEAIRDVYRAKRDVVLPALEAAGLEPAGGDATFFLWMRVPGGGDDAAWAMDLLERGIACAPGSFFGPEGAGHVRFALVPTLADCERAAAILRG
jgi:acetylornithine aminotransferase